MHAIAISKTERAVTLALILLVAFGAAACAVGGSEADFTATKKVDAGGDLGSSSLPDAGPKSDTFVPIDDSGLTSDTATTPADDTAPIDDAGVMPESGTAPGADTGTLTDVGPVGDCLSGTTIDLLGSPPHAWVCTVSSVDLSTTCPTKIVTDATTCGPTGGMWGFYRMPDGSFEFRNSNIVKHSAGTLYDIGTRLTALPEDTKIEIYFSDSRYLWFKYKGTTVTLLGFTMIPPK
jgi:hypothetical protein